MDMSIHLCVEGSKSLPFICFCFFLSPPPDQGFEARSKSRVDKPAGGGRAGLLKL